jgi:hypothetical protein
MRALPNDSKEPDIWLGNLGQLGDSLEFSVFEETVREFVQKAVSELEKRKADDRIYRWPKFRLAVNVIGSGYGGARQTKGQLLRGLIRALDELAVEHGVDIVLVAYGDKAYAAAQRAPQRSRAAKPFGHMALSRTGSSGVGGLCETSRGRGDHKSASALRWRWCQRGRRGTDME